MPGNRPDRHLLGPVQPTDLSPVLHMNHPLLLTLEEDQDDQKIAKWVTVHPPISGPFSPVAETRTQKPAP
ncbi:hypothetical protein ABZ904_29230, partial [Streptomyces sp. NPDC046900]|uniref:hypothetical protein n=1 Tax=Streptomyces sp. NPDC046900 TaxID=3155473 RepID=UPI0033C85402